jgi:hypothetical protein
MGAWWIPLLFDDRQYSVATVPPTSAQLRPPVFLAFSNRGGAKDASVSQSWVCISAYSGCFSDRDGKIFSEVMYVKLLIKHRANFTGFLNGFQTSNFYWALFKPSYEGKYN